MEIILVNDMLVLKKHLSKILDFIEDRNDVVFVDFPLYYNVGDLLILAGTINFFKNNSINVKLYLSTSNFNDININKVITKNTTIICQGGGNFGDIYDIHQNLREDIVKKFPENRIIILPQTAFFNKNDNKEKSKKIFKEHNNVIMFARDEVTYKIFTEFTKYTYLIPDMAHELYGDLPKSKKNKNILYFLRKDVEKRPIQAEIEETIKGYDCFDWDDLISIKDKRILSFIYRLIQINRILKLNSLNNLIFKIWYKHAYSLVFKMSKVFSSYESIVTSRLHGHILSCLVDVPSSIIDNSYGKNTEYYKVWTKDLEITSVVDK